MNSYQLLHILFIGFGLYAIIHPNQLSSQNIETSYSVTDLIRGWVYILLQLVLLLVIHKKNNKYY